MDAYEQVHVVCFEETNVVGNVYFTQYVSWQGRCRELFLREHAPEVVHALARDLRMVTTRVSCEYFAELRAFDEVVIRMRLHAATQTRVTMDFEYLRRTAEGEELVARGAQEVACLRQRSDGTTVSAPLPRRLREALDAYAPLAGSTAT